ncbi:VirB6/TrbL-like conjugal transfer protein, CD1112 family [Peribacillus frigoritolerans]|uniref:VirB6/TrbL-like conjugal transfer protein, CD1112 family n=1 Tax=Peribacillus TaxID=2675229 RepID=UPI0021A45504|nr:CD0415/CD1112 family protein [Peribacillus frigoritolerans]MCT1389849.1 CD0415/CD1112 family protein [Peribacillus frigoritolerans]
MFDSWIEDIKEFIFKMFMEGTESFLDMIIELFGKSISTVRMNVSETPTEFSSTIVDNLRVISETAILPVAGLILTYVFCYELYQFVVERNRGGDFETGQLLFLIIKTSVMILLLSNSFTIALAVFDLGKWITDQVPDSTLTIPSSIKDDVISSIEDGEIGKAISMWLVTGIALIMVFIMSGIIYLVAWGRIITILLYISIAPIPFATFLNREWIGSIGQTYVKNLLALMLQGYFMLVCLVIYAGLLEKSSSLIVAEGNALYALMLMLVSMAILVVTLTRTHSLAKSVVGVV